MMNPEALSRKEVDAIRPDQVHKVLGKVMLVDGFDVVYDLDQSHGTYLHDSLSGKDFMDFFSFFASWPVSHNHPKLKDPVFQKQLTRAAATNPANSDIYTVEMAQFVATFHRVAMPQEFKHLFLIQGGSNAVENALKTAFDWKVRKNIAAGRGEKGSKIIHFKEAFHGRGGYTLSLTNTQDPKKTLYFPQFNWPRVENPKVKFPLTHGKNLEETIQAENRSLNQIKSILQSEGTDIAALIIEPIQGEGGDNHFRPEFFQQLRKICSENEILFICDEVQAGLGLTGKFWAYQHYNIVPDIVVFGKKAQVCGIIATARVDEVKDNVFQLSSRINSTWGGNLVDMVRSRKFLEIIEEENLVQNASQVGSYLLQQIEKLGNQFPSLISNVRGKGLLVSFDVPNANYCSKVKELSYHRGMLIISCGVSTIRFRPFLDTTIKEVDVLVRNLREVFAEIFALPQSKL